MNFKDWYTDRMDIHRTEGTVQGRITRRARVLAAEGVPCRVYNSAKPPVAMGKTAASASGTDRLMCDIRVDIRKGDEVLVSRSGGPPRRYFAGPPTAYPEPFGAVLPGLAHQELSISEEEWT